MVSQRLDHPTVAKARADQGFAGRVIDWYAAILHRTLEIVRKQHGQRGFQVQPERWAAESTFAWITMRRLASDYERRPAHSETVIRWAMTDVIPSRLTRDGPDTRGRRPPWKTTP